MKRTRHRRWAVALGAAAAGLASGRAYALQDFIPYTGGVYSQDFNNNGVIGLPTSNGGSPAYVDGGVSNPYRVPSQSDRSHMLTMVYNYLDAWEFVSNVGTAVRFRVDTGTDITGSTYSYGNASNPSDRALGALSSVSQEPFFGFNLRNDTGATITQITLSYRGEQYRQNGAGSLAFSYVIQSVLSGYDVSLGGTTAPVLDFAAPKTGASGAIDGNAAGNFSYVTATLSGLSWGPTQYLWLRWNRAGANSPGLAIDDLSFVANAAAATGTQTIATLGQSAPGAGGGTFNLFGGTSGLAAFYSGLTGTSDGSTNGLFRGNGGAITAIARDQQAAPGGGNFTNFSNPAVNAAGQVAFYASLTAGGAGIFRGDGTTTLNYARIGGATALGGTYSSLFNPGINSAGQLAFYADISGGTSTRALFRADAPLPTLPVTIARVGQTVAGFGDISDFNIQTPTPINASGQIAFTAMNTSFEPAILRGSGGALTVIAKLAQTAPGTGGSTFNNFTSNPVLNDSGQVAFFANVSGGTPSRGAFRGDGTTLTAIVVDGQSAPAAGGATGGVIQILYPDPQINNAGQVAFVADIDGSTSTDGIFRGSGGALTAIARHLQAAPGGGTFDKFINLVGATPAFALAPGGQVAFNADLVTTESTSTDAGIFEGDGVDLVVVARKGTLINGVPVTSVQRIAPDAINSFGQVAYQATLGDGTTSLYLFTPTLHYRVAVNGSWDTSSNWTLGLAPAAVHDVVIDPNVTVTIAGPAAPTIVKSLTMGGGAATATLNNNAGPLIITGNLSVAFGNTFTTGGTLSAAAIFNNGTFTQSGTSTHTGNFTNGSGTGTLGGAQTWSNGTQIIDKAGAVNLTSDPGSATAYNVVLMVTPPTGGGALTHISTSPTGVHLRSMAVNPVGTAGDGLLVIDAAPAGSVANSHNGFGGAGGSVAVYLGNGAGNPGLAPRATAENLWRSAALEGYWAVQNHVGGITASTRGLTLAAGVVTNSTTNGLVVIPSVDAANQPATYVGEDINGDTNGDGKVDINDLGFVLQHLNTTPGTLPGEGGGVGDPVHFTLYMPAEGDVNGDLVVNISDLGIVLGNLNQTYNPSASAPDPGPIPEPATCTLLALGAAALLRRRIR